MRVSGAAPDVVAIEAGRYRLSGNPKIGYEPRPGVSYDGNAFDLYAFRGSGNNLGYRDYEHAIGKPPGVYRIVVLGDSLGVGFHVDRREDTFPAELESLLRQGGMNAEVINLSVSGYNTQQEVETLKERGLQYRPDLVVLAYCLNDRVLNDGGMLETLLDMERDSKGIPRVRVGGRLLIRSALYRFLRYQVFRPGGRRASAERQARFEEIEGDTTGEYFRVLERLGRENGFRILVAVFPELSDLSGYRYWGEHLRVESMARERGFDHLDLLKPFQFCEAMADEPIGYDRYHPTRTGHLCAADAIAAYVQEKILTAPPPAPPASLEPPGEGPR